MTQQANRWRSLGRVFLYLLGCAFVLALTASLPLARRGPAQELIIGSVASLGSFALTVLFVRWDGLRLRDVGAMPTSESPALFAIRAEVGLWRPEIETAFEGTASWAGIWCYVAVIALATLGFWCWHRAQETASRASSPAHVKR
jgi:hypothetical protein